MVYTYFLLLVKTRHEYKNLMRKPQESICMGNLQHRMNSLNTVYNQMQIRIACGLDLRSRAGFWKNDSRCTCRKNNTIIYYFISYL